MKPLIFAALAMCALDLAAIHAATIANRPTTRNTTLGFTLWASEAYPNAPTYARAYDQFTPAKDAAIGTVQWEGAYVNQATPTANPDKPNTASFEVSFWSDNAGQPGQKLDSTTVDLADLHPKSLGNLPYFFSAASSVPVPAFAYTAALPRAFSASAGQTYWLSIVSNSTAQEPTWGWVSGTGGDNATVQDFAGQRFVRDGMDRTFKLKSAAGEILTDVNGRAFAAGALLPLTASFEAPEAGDAIQRVDFLADGAVFASLDGDGNPLSSASDRLPVRKASDGPPASGAIFQATYTMPGADRLISLVARALTVLGKTKTSAAISVQAVSSTADRPPVVGLSAPASARVGQTVSVPVTATDPDAGDTAARGKPIARGFDVPSGLIAKVEYYLNALKVKESAQAPFGYDFTPSKAGAYVLTAIATDGSGLATASAPVRVEAVATPTVTVAVKGAAAVQEGAGSAKFLIARDKADSSADLTVQFTLSGTAQNGIDYQELPDSIVIPAGATGAKLKVKPVNDAAPQGKRTVKIKLAASPAGDYTIGAAKKATIALLDND